MDLAVPFLYFNDIKNLLYAFSNNIFLLKGPIVVIFSFVLQINRVLKALEEPYSDTSGLEPLDACGGKEQRMRDLTVCYDRKPPAWAQRICIT